MKAAIIADKNKLEIIERGIPKSNGDRVVIKVAYTGICGSDLHYWGYGDTWAKGWIMGHEFTGYIEDPGDRPDLKKGDRVVCLPSKACLECSYCKAGNTNCCEAPLTEAIGIGTPGAFSEYVMVRSHLPLKLEDHVALDEAAVVEPAAVGLFAAKLAQVKRDDRILIVGAGIIGLMTAMWVKKFGAKNITIAETGDNRIALAKRFNFANQIIDAKSSDFLEKVITANGGELYDQMFECVGVHQTLNGYLRAVKSGGRVIVMGVPNDPIPFDFNTFVVRNMQMIASHAWNFDDFKEALRALTAGEINLKQFITDVRSLKEVQAAFEDLTSGDTKDIKILLNVGNE